jgi:peroxiredoxin
MVDTKQTAIAPGFTVTDSEGKTIRLANYKNKKHVVLVFNRGFG